MPRQILLITNFCEKVHVLQDKPGRLEKAGIKRATEQVEIGRENRDQGSGRSEEWRSGEMRNEWEVGEEKLEAKG